ncbi:CC0125/CC1285 family lipoprotein [Colwellia sp. 12G3]|uniref:CC0125/CC1285 family lipoprotein n=1 Tax=Colwellia sp. 12G3 TaxID=2058299 RepID=UPI000C3253C1|nr:hypothetical protein [Colwellia sp. 12G3]PKI17104.1 hypothetical protein CXF71_07685 [Colwellia sp. 12G3]
MNTNILVISLLGFSLLSGCSTSYQSNGFTGGYSSSQLDENVFTVSFKGNGYTSKEKVKDFVLLRSAELALENGYPYFVIIDKSAYSEESSYTTASNSTTTGQVSNTGYMKAHTTNTGGQTYNYSKPTNSNTIVGFKVKPESFSYSAKYLVKSLKTKYDIEA